MAKTPLLQALQHLAADYRLARAYRLPLHAIRELRAAACQRAKDAPADAAAVFTRRQLLVGSGATLVTLPRLTTAATVPHIAIVGGGIAGLTCALHLADQGIAATVYEASGRVGGRMFSNASGYWDDNQVSEWGGEFIDSGHTTIRRLGGCPRIMTANRLGLREVCRF